MQLTSTFIKTGIFLLICVVVAKADVRLPAIFADQMILQQESTITIWGWAEPGQKISVNGSWQSSWNNTLCDLHGNWKLRIPTTKAGGPYTLRIRGNNEIVLKDILLGEVWICSGQSNMDLKMASLRSEIGNEDIANANYSQIRLFTINKTFTLRPQRDIQGAWKACTPENVNDFSAVAFYFGRKLHTELNVPVGLISASWGGTPVESWTSANGLKPYQQYAEILTMLEAPENIQSNLEKHYAQKLLAWETQVENLDKGIRAGWNKPNMDDSDWKMMELPSVWAGTELDKLDGIVWFRRMINIPPSWLDTDLELHLGGIDDIDTVWFNGLQIGTTFGWNTPRQYRIPASILNADKNSIAVRVIDISLGGGFVGNKEDMRIGSVGTDIKRYAPLAGTWKYQISSTKTLPVGPIISSVIDQCTPTTLYNAMIHPIIPFRIAGVIWYQGEANCFDPIPYRTLFPAMITDWRNQWKLGDFPFYYVQIAPYQYNKQTYSQAIREAQLRTLDKVPNAGMAVTMDIGNEWDVHPVNKWDVGTRLALWALAKTYGQQNIVFSGPLYKVMKIEQNKIRIFFNYTEGGLVAKDGLLTDFMIAGQDHAFVPAKAVIEGDTVVVSNPEIGQPAAVRYAWSNWARPNLFNAAGLPASSFRTDDWPLNETSQSEPKK